MATLSAVITEEAPPAPHAGPLAPVLEGLLHKDPEQRLDAPAASRLLQAVVDPPAATRAFPVPAGPVAPAPVAPPPPPVRVDPPVTSPTPAAAPSTGPATASPAGPRPGWRPGWRPGRRPGWLLPALAALLVVAVVGLGVALWPDGEGGTPDPAASPSQPATTDPAATTPSSGAADPTGEPAESAPAESTPAESTPAAPTTSADPGPDAVPAGFVRYEDPTGFSVVVPAGWAPEQDGPRVYLRDPDSSAYLMVDQTDEPAGDPVADWQRQEPAVAERLENYERVGEIVPVDFRGWQAADWQFVFGEQQGTRVLNRNVVTAPDQAYALYWSAPAARWDELLPVHEQVVAGFRPAG